MTTPTLEREIDELSARRTERTAHAACTGRVPKSGRIAPERPERLEIRLSTEERRRLEERARRGGYDSIAGYVRARTLGPSGPAGQSPRPAA